MSKCFKLTNQLMRTYGNFQYTLGEWTPTLPGADVLCRPVWYHVYDHPLLAVLFNTIHAKFIKPKLFAATYDGRLLTRDNLGMMRGVRRIRLDEEVPLPKLTPAQRVRFAIYCARSVYHRSEWIAWTRHWLGGLDRSEAAARRAMRSVKEPELQMGHAASQEGKASRSAKAAAGAAEYADGAEPKPFSIRWGQWSESGIRAVARAAEGAAMSSQLAETPKIRTASYWVEKAEKAIADEAKVVVEAEGTIKPLPINAVS